MLLVTTPTTATNDIGDNTKVGYIINPNNS